MSSNVLPLGGSFDESVVGPVRTLLRRPVRLPNIEGAVWSVADSDRGVELCLTVPARALTANFQKDAAASPFFLIAFAFWLERVYPGLRASCRVAVTHDAADLNPSERCHLRRSMFVLEEVRRLLGGRMSLDIPSDLAWRWPEVPTFNFESEERNDAAGVEGEAEIERFLCRDPRPLRDLQAHESISHFKRQMPVGLFDGIVSQATEWTIRGHSAIDLWGTSEDTETLHLFELKKAGYIPLGILSEASYYALLLSYVRDRAANRPPIVIDPKAKGLNAARCASRIVMWLSAPALHPLVHSLGTSPLEWLNEGARAIGVEFRILPFDWTSPSRFSWRFNDAWPIAQHGPM